MLLILTFPGVKHMFIYWFLTGGSSPRISSVPVPPIASPSLSFLMSQFLHYANERGTLCYHAALIRNLLKHIDTIQIRTSTRDSIKV